MLDASNIDVEDMLECLEIQNVSQATIEELRFSCPFPSHNNGDSNASGYINTQTAMFFCHGCKRHGSAIDFAAYVLHVSPIAAIQLLKERYQPGFLNPDARSSEEEVRKIISAARVPLIVQPQLDEAELLRFAVDWEQADKVGGFGPTDYILQRGFSPQSLEEWNFGYDERMRRVTFGVRDVSGKLIGFKARATNGREPKYMVLGDKPGKGVYYGFPPYHTGRVVFGAHMVKNRLESPLVVCEGELNAVAIDQKLGIPAVAINGSNFTAAQAKILRGIAERVVLFFDSDPAGYQAEESVVQALKPYMSVHLVDDHDKDAADMDASEIQDLLDSSKSWTLAAISC